MAAPPGRSTFQLRITLLDVNPSVWRRILVPGAIHLDKLHLVLQAAMGWTNSHLHCFRVAEDLYGTHFDDYPEDEIDEHDVSVLQALRDQERFTYEYDFGDSWDHEIEVEALTRSRVGLKYAVCLAGANACPPEDCGGPPGYEHLLAVMADPSHEEHGDLLQWVGGSFDASGFDLASANAELQRVR